MGAIYLTVERSELGSEELFHTFMVLGTVRSGIFFSLKVQDLTTYINSDNLSHYLLKKAQAFSTMCVR